MPKLPILAVLPALAAIAPLFAVPAAPPVRGPGAVIQAVQDLVGAVDKGDRAALEKIVVGLRRQEGYACGFDAKGSIVEEKPAGDMLFQDVAADGTVVVRNERKAAIDALLTAVGGKDRGLKTTLRRIVADCPSGDCSWGSVEFERTFRRDGREVTVPMRATVLVRYESEDQRMRVFLWHASAAPAPAPAATKQ